jgi:riboflavin synthase
VSLTVNTIDADVFDVNIVPHTLTATTLGQLKIGDQLNIEVDIIARHLEQLLNKNES